MITETIDVEEFTKEWEASKDGPDTIKPLVVPNPAMSMLQVIEKAASNPRMNVDKMRELLDMQKELMSMQAEIEFNQAMAALQPSLPFIDKKGRIAFEDKKGNQRDTPYARFEDIEAAIRPLYTARGFSTSYDTSNLPNGKIVVTLTIAHVAGHKRTYSTPGLENDTSGSKNALQAIGSTMSYGKRYCLCNGFGIVIKGEDDDGLKGGAKPNKPDPFEKKVTEQAKKSNESPTDSGLIKKAESLREEIKQHKTIKEREAVIGKNLNLLRDLNSAGREDVVKTLHALVKKGEK